MDRSLEGGNSCPRDRGHRWTRRDTLPRIWAKPNASKRSVLTRAVRCERFFNQRIQLSTLRIFLDLSIPARIFIRDEPIAKGGKRLVVELLNISFNQFNLAHKTPRTGFIVPIVARLCHVHPTPAVSE